MRCLHMQASHTSCIGILMEHVTTSGMSQACSIFQGKPGQASQGPTSIHTLLVTHCWSLTAGHLLLVTQGLSFQSPNDRNSLLVRHFGHTLLVTQRLNHSLLVRDSSTTMASSGSSAATTAHM
jgi:hypothetical protein